MNMYEQDLALNNLQKLICHKTQPTQLKILKLFIFIKFTQKDQQIQDY